MPDNDDNKDGQIGDGQGTGDGDGKGEQVSLGQVVQAVKWMVSKMQQVDSRFDKLDKQQTAPTDKGTDDAKPPTAPEAPDLDEMDRGQFAQFIIESTAKTVKESLIDPLRAQFGESENRSERRHIETDIDTTSSKYNDFWDWKDEVSKTLSDHPDLSVDDAYHLARGKNPDKLSAIEAKAQEAKDVEDTKERQAKEEEFGGLLPTSGLASRNEGMESEDAANAAYTELIEGTPMEKLLQQQ